MTRRARQALWTAALGGLTACADGATAPAAPSLNQSGGRGDFHRYVAIGTSVSMGVASDGVVGASQRSSWPALLATMAGRDMSLPLIAEPGCGAPLVAPLALGVRVGGTPAAGFSGCAPNAPGVELPAANVAVDGARTSEALSTTAADYAVSNPRRAALLSRVLAPGQTQLSAMIAQNPKIVSVELGANELLGVRSGLYLPGVTVVPVGAWMPQYDQVLDAVAGTGAKGILVGLIDDVRNFPAFRTGAEIWANRFVLAALKVTVLPDCGGANAANLVFVPVKVVGTVGAAAGSPVPLPLTCQNGIGFPTVASPTDYVLTPGDVALVNAQLAQMDAHIASRAAERGWAHFRLAALYESSPKPAYHVMSQLTSPQPYGPFISLDGYHPSAAGQRLLAEAAARAVNTAFHMGIGVSPAAAFASR